MCQTFCNHEKPIYMWILDFSLLVFHLIKQSFFVCWMDKREGNGNDVKQSGTFVLIFKHLVNYKRIFLLSKKHDLDPEGRLLNIKGWVFVINFEKNPYDKPILKQHVNSHLAQYQFLLWIL